MPEAGAALVEAFATEGGAAAAEGAAVEAGAGGAAAAAAGSEVAGAGLAAEAGGAFVGGEGVVGGGAAVGSGAAAGSALTSLDTTGGEGIVGGAGGAEAGALGGGAGGGFWNTLTQAFQGNGATGSIFGKGGTGMGIAQVLSSLYGLEQSKKLQQQASPKGATKAGLDSVTRGMAAQGYQGSGNMMAALERYGADTNQGNPGAQQAALMGQLSSLGLLTSGVPKMFGWGDSGSPTGGGTP